MYNRILHGLLDGFMLEILNRKIEVILKGEIQSLIKRWS